MGMEALTSITANLWYSFLGFVPNLVGALILLIVGYIVGKVAGMIVREILVRVGVDNYLKKEEHLKFKASSVFDVITRWLLYIIFIKAATDLLGISSLSEIMRELIYFIPGLVGAAIIIIVAYGVGLYIKDEILAEKTIYSDLVGKTIFFLILYLGIAVALPLVGINPTIVNNLLLVIVGALGLGVAIAIGLGLKDVVKDMAKDYAKDFQMKRKRMQKKRK